MFGFFEKLRDHIVNWCVNAQEITIGDLHALHNPSKCEIYNGSELKFVEQTTINKTFVKTDIGYSPIKHSMKTVEYDAWELKTATHELYAADEHVVITADGREVYIRDVKPGDILNTDTGPEPVS